MKTCGMCSPCARPTQRRCARQRVRCQAPPTAWRRRPRPSRHTSPARRSSAMCKDRGGRQPVDESAGLSDGLHTEPVNTPAPPQAQPDEDLDTLARGGCWCLHPQQSAAGALAQPVAPTDRAAQVAAARGCKRAAAGTGPALAGLWADAACLPVDGDRRGGGHAPVGALAGPDPVCRRPAPLVAAATARPCGISARCGWAVGAGVQRLDRPAAPTGAPRRGSCGLPPAGPVAATPSTAGAGQPRRMVSRFRQPTVCTA